jgi:hypothetical protein
VQNFQGANFQYIYHLTDFQNASHTLQRNKAPHGKEHLLHTQSTVVIKVILSNFFVDAMNITPFNSSFFSRTQSHFLLLVVNWLLVANGTEDQVAKQQ